MSGMHWRTVGLLCAGLSLFSVGTVQAAHSVGGACSRLGETLLDDDRTTTIGCFKLKDTQADCGTEASPTCIYKQMATPGNLVRVSFEIVGGGGGGGGGDWQSNGGPGGAGDVLRFDTYMPKGSPVTLSVGAGGTGGMSSALGKSLGDGGSGLMANGGDGGGTDGSNTPQVGPSGVGGGGAAASVVTGDGIFAVAGGGGGGGGGSCMTSGGGGNAGVGGATGPDGKDGLNGCNGRDGGGGGGGGGGYPGGLGGVYGCDNSCAGYGGTGGQKGKFYYNLSRGLLPFSRTANDAGVGFGGGAGSFMATPVNGANGACGRITIWSSTGTKFQFDCGGVSPPVWTIQ